jgi:hypothetical protein
MDHPVGDPHHTAKANQVDGKFHAVHLNPTFAGTSTVELNTCETPDDGSEVYEHPVAVTDGRSPADTSPEEVYEMTDADYDMPHPKVPAKTYVPPDEMYGKFHTDHLRPTLAGALAEELYMQPVPTAGGYPKQVGAPAQEVHSQMHSGDPVGGLYEEPVPDRTYDSQTNASPTCPPKTTYGFTATADVFNAPVNEFSGFGGGNDDDVDLNEMYGPMNVVQNPKHGGNDDDIDLDDMYGHVEVQPVPGDDDDDEEEDDDDDDDYDYDL